MTLFRRFEQKLHLLRFLPKNIHFRQGHIRKKLFESVKFVPKSDGKHTKTILILPLKK